MTSSTKNHGIDVNTIRVDLTVEGLNRSSFTYLVSAKTMVALMQIILCIRRFEHRAKCLVCCICDKSLVPVCAEANQNKTKSSFVDPDIAHFTLLVAR